MNFAINVTLDPRNTSIGIDLLFRDAFDYAERKLDGSSKESSRPKLIGPQILTDALRLKIEGVLAFIFGQSQETIHRHATHLESIQFYDPPYLEDGFKKVILITDAAWNRCIGPLITALGTSVEIADFTFAIIADDVVKKVLATNIPKVIVTQLLFNPRPDASADLSGYDYSMKHIRPHRFKTETVDCKLQSILSGLQINILKK